MPFLTEALPRVREISGPLEKYFSEDFTPSPFDYPSVQPRCRFVPAEFTVWARSIKRCGRTVRFSASKMLDQEVCECRLDFGVNLPIVDLTCRVLQAIFIAVACAPRYSPFSCLGRWGSKNPFDSALYGNLSFEFPIGTSSWVVRFAYRGKHRQVGTCSSRK